MMHKIFKSVKLGIGPKNSDDFIREMKKKGCRCFKGVRATLNNSAFIKSLADKERKVDLVVISSKELGFEHETTLRKIYEEAQKRKLRLCSSEVAPQLCLQPKPVRSGVLQWLLWFIEIAQIPEYLWIAMEPINGRIFAVFLRKDMSPGFSLHVFGDSSWIDSLRSKPEDLWIFIRPEKEKRSLTEVKR